MNATSRCPPLHLVPDSAPASSSHPTLSIRVSPVEFDTKRESLICRFCGRPVGRVQCIPCDDYYFKGHAPTCPRLQAQEGPGGDNHPLGRDHWTYQDNRSCELPAV